MKKHFFLLMTALLLTVGLQANGTVVRDTINGVPCRVYVPQGDEKYQVLYLQHGMWGDENDWVEKGNLVQIMDSLLQVGDIEEMVVVMPDNCPHRNTYEEEKANATNGEWEANFAAFMAEAEAKYPIDADPRTRAIAGLSMGGYHTMMIAHRLDGQFAYVGMFSPATFEHHYSPSAKLYWIGIGAEDFLYDSVMEYKKWLNSLPNVEYTLVETGGGHDWNNWRDYIVTFLKLINRRERVTSPDGRTELTFRLTKDDAPEYCVKKDGKTVIDWSKMGFVTADEDLTRGYSFTDEGRRQSVNDRWATVWGEERWIQDHHNELRQLMSVNGRTMAIVFRVFDDGFASLDNL